MNQAERLTQLKEIDGDIGRLEIKVKEAEGRLTAAQLRRQQLLKDCTHRKANGRTALESGMFGDECTICLWKDF